MRRIQDTVALVVMAMTAMVALWGCDQDANVSNLPGHVAFVGPTQADMEGNVVTWFGVSDPEGDFVSAQVEVCPEAGACFIPDLQPGGVVPETLGNLPAVREERAPALKAIWRPECGQGALSGPEVRFTVRISVLATDIEPSLESLDSASTTLTELGLACP